MRHLDLRAFREGALQQNRTLRITAETHE
jgi:hypothetical protein